MEQLSQELQQAIAHREAMQARVIAALNPPPIDPTIKARGYVAIKAVVGARQARLAAAVEERDAAIVAYEDVKARFFAAYHNR